MPQRPRITKVGWRFHNAIEELEQWRHWALDTAQRFHTELTDYTTKAREHGSGVTAVQLDASTHIREELLLVISSLKKVKKHVTKIQGRRIKRERAA